MHDCLAAICAALKTELLRRLADGPGLRPGSVTCQRHRVVIRGDVTDVWIEATPDHLLVLEAPDRASGFIGPRRVEYSDPEMEAVLAAALRRHGYVYAPGPQ